VPARHRFPRYLHRSLSHSFIRSIAHPFGFRPTHLSHPHSASLELQRLRFQELEQSHRAVEDTCAQWQRELAEARAEIGRVRSAPSDERCRELAGV
jgi:hypothetical protein